MSTPLQSGPQNAWGRQVVEKHFRDLLNGTYGIRMYVGSRETTFRNVKIPNASPGAVFSGTVDFPNTPDGPIHFRDGCEFPYPNFKSQENGNESTPRFSPGEQVRPENREMRIRLQNTTPTNQSGRPGLVTPPSSSLRPVPKHTRKQRKRESNANENNIFVSRHPSTTTRHATLRPPPDKRPRRIRPENATQSQVNTQARRSRGANITRDSIVNNVHARVVAGTTTARLDNVEVNLSRNRPSPQLDANTGDAYIHPFALANDDQSRPLPYAEVDTFPAPRQEAAPLEELSPPFIGGITNFSTNNIVAMPRTVSAGRESDRYRDPSPTGFTNSRNFGINAAIINDISISFTYSR